MEQLRTQIARKIGDEHAKTIITYQSEIREFKHDIDNNSNVSRQYNK